MRGGPGRHRGSNIALFEPGSRVSHPSPTAPRCFFGDRRRGRSVENALPLYLFRAGGVRDRWASSERNIAPIRRVERHPKPISRRHGDPTPLDQWHGADGAIHALSTATIPRQSNRGGQRLGCQATPETDPLATRKLTPHLLINGTASTGLSTLCPRRRSPDNQVAVGKGWVTPSTASADGRSRPSRCRLRCSVRGGRQSGHHGHRPGMNIASNQLGTEVAEVRRTGGTPRFEHRPYQVAELRFPRFAHRASVVFRGSAPGGTPESRVLATASTPHARPPVVSLWTTPSGLQP